MKMKLPKMNENQVFLAENSSVVSALKVIIAVVVALVVDNLSRSSFFWKE